MNALPRSLAVAVMAAAAPWLVAPAAAAPTSSPLALHSAVGSSVEVVQYRRGFRRGYRGRGFGGVGVGLGIAGAIVGGAIIASQPRGYYGYGGYDPGYDQGYVAVSPYAGDGEVAYCQQRFRSYDLRSGTYLGFDGQRHPCP
jgi:hypothetical protein